MKYIIRPAPVVDVVEADEEDALADSENFHCQFPTSKPKPNKPPFCSFHLPQSSNPLFFPRTTYLGLYIKPPPRSNFSKLTLSLF